MTKIGRMLVVTIGGAAIAATSACSGSNESETPAANNAAAPPTANATPAATPVAYASLTGDAAKGATVFLQCKACHVIEQGQNRVGPSLHAIVGRTAGQVPGFAYSAANKSSGLVWTEDTLYEYLEDPRAKVPGTKMVFAGLKAPQDRADVIAYLRDNAK